MAHFKLLATIVLSLAFISQVTVARTAPSVTIACVQTFFCLVKTLTSYFSLRIPGISRSVRQNTSQVQPSSIVAPLRMMEVGRTDRLPSTLAHQVLHLLCLFIRRRCIPNANICPK
ncbi:hypothetical protein FPV67DRAFT_1473790 [Lyophyllum atratum]|nr:hypothetical protein FPV67DRAFT_1473790 [Lyophyllum atratum]